MNRFFRLIPCTLVLAWLPGCATREPLPTQYVLTRGGTTPAASAAGMKVVIRTVDVPAYLGTTQQIATRRGENGVTYAPTERWAEPLTQSIGQALAEALARQPGIGPVTTGPDASGAAVEVRVKFERFEGAENGEVTLAAHWIATTPGGAGIVAQGTSQELRTGWKPGDYAGLAANLSAELDVMSGEIARKLR